MLHARYVYRQPRNRPNVATNSIYIYIFIYLTPTNHYTIHLEPKKTYKFQTCLFFPNLRTYPANPPSLHGVGRISPSSTQARRRTWWSLRPRAARGRLSPRRSPEHRRSTWSECADRAPNWSGTWHLGRVVWFLDYPFGGFIATQLWSCEKADEKSETPTDQTI